MWLYNHKFTGLEDTIKTEAGGGSNKGTVKGKRRGRDGMRVNTHQSKPGGKRM